LSEEFAMKADARQVDDPVHRIDPCGAVPPPQPKPLHRLAAARLEQHVTRRSLARRMGVTVAVVKQEERADADIAVSTLRRWERALQVPVGELLEDPLDELAPDVAARARLIRALGLAKALCAQGSERTREIAAEIVEHLSRLVPEAKHVRALLSGGGRQPPRFGRAAERPIPSTLFGPSAER
jgi:transcriptional regulator with XRE-family HTH domain